MSTNVISKLFLEQVADTSSQFNWLPIILAILAIVCIVAAVIVYKKRPQDQSKHKKASGHVVSAIVLAIAGIIALIFACTTQFANASPQTASNLMGGGQFAKHRGSRNNVWFHQRRARKSNLYRRIYH